MDNPAVGGRHGIELHCSATGDGALGHALGQCGQLAGTPLTVLLDVQRDAGGAAFAPAEREVDEELERAEGLAAVADEQTGIAALDIDDRHLFAVAGTPYGCRRVHIHPVEEASNDAECDGGGAVPPGDGPDTDLGILSADAEDPAAPVANDVYFEFVSTDAELQGCELYCFLHCLR